MRELFTPVVVKYLRSLATLLALGIAWLDGNGGLAGENNLITIGIMVGGWVVSIVGVAAVMRSDVKRLNRQQEHNDDQWREHLALHNQMTSMLAELRQMNSDAKERMDRLDARLDRRGGK